jgi:hypothetical protein
MAGGKMTPIEMKAEAFDKIAKMADRSEPALAKMARIFDIITKLERDEKRFWKRMAKFEKDIYTGKNRMCQLTRYVSPPIYLDGSSKTDERGYNEIWNPDTKTWERQEKAALPEIKAGGN